MDRWGKEGLGGGPPQQQWNPYAAGPATNSPYNSQQNVQPPVLTPAAMEIEEMSPVRKVLLKGQPKVLGAVQLIITFIHIALGTIIIQLDSGYYHYTYTAAYGSNLWSIPFLIISGSLSVSVEAKKNPTPTLVKAFMSMNIVSAIEALGTIFIFSVDIYYCYYIYSLRTILIFMVIFNLLEFSIAVSLSHFGRLANNTMLTGQPAAQVYTMPEQFSNPMTSPPDPTQRFGGPNPYV